MIGLLGVLTTGAARVIASQNAFETPHVTVALPANLRLPDVVRPLVTIMWLRSPTFRRQCARLGEHPAVVVTIELVPSIENGRALTCVERHDAGTSAKVQIELRRPGLYIEHIAHELEHILEDVDGVDHPRLARQRVDGIAEMGGRYETARARSVGRAVAHEVLFR